MYLLLLIMLLLPPSGISVRIDNIRSAKGAVYLAVFDHSESFPEAGQARLKKIVPVTATGMLEIHLPDLPAGAYAFSCFHDVNGNGKLDKNLLGIPTEPYGFSNRARPKFRAPTFEEARVSCTPDLPVSIKLEKW